MSDTEHDPSSNLNSSFHVGQDILNILFSRTFLCITDAKQHIYHFSLNLLCLKGWVTVYYHQMFYYYQNPAI